MKAHQIFLKGRMRKYWQHMLSQNIHSMFNRCLETYILTKIKMFFLLKFQQNLVKRQILNIV
ncbi:hypothetical protein HMPREF9443_01001 [Phascolarctobacterium succinatutens YIT 12067]|uniref:Uncharacterized protein n=1 Tax=Phascolarctobacterium succinatutens YIT 12067 TaxID=626939 RepID=E8LDS3_9FIRM|nr:hypothetical protein HMPREF9443_01001 [Phascolarctobacterium succinatutens YIT 12067]